MQNTIQSAPAGAVYDETFEPASITFGNFRLDIGRRLLWSGSVSKPVSEKLLHMLLMFLRSRGSIISKNELAHGVWPGQRVSLSNLNQHIFLLRQLLGESARDHEYIITYPRKGFRFALSSVHEAYEVEANDSAPEPAAGLPNTANRHAFSLYCQGSYYLEQDSRPSLERAVASFEAVLAEDPAYDPASLALARAYALLGTNQGLPPRTAYFKSRTIVERLLAGSAATADVYALLCELELFYGWDFEAARRALDIALRIGPRCSAVRSSVVWYNVCAGNPDRALAEAERNLISQPASLARQLVVGRVLTYAGDFEHAIARMSAILESNPNYAQARRYRAHAHLLHGQPEHALQDILCLPESVREANPALLARAYADRGNEHLVRQIHQDMERPEGEHVSSFALAVVTAALGQSDQALRELQRAFLEHDPGLLQLSLLPQTRTWFVALESLPDFQNIMRALPAVPHRSA